MEHTMMEWLYTAAACGMNGDKANSGLFLKAENCRSAAFVVSFDRKRGPWIQSKKVVCLRAALEF